MEPEDVSRNRPKPDPVTIDLGAQEVTEVPSADSDGTEDNVTADVAPETVAESKPDASEQAPKSYSGIPNSTTSARAPAESSRGQSSLGLIAASLLGGVIA